MRRLLIFLIALFSIISAPVYSYAEAGEGKGNALYYDEEGNFNQEAFEQSLIIEQAVAASEETEGNEEKQSAWTVFLLGFVGGLLALLTPCVFPMIPLTVSFFTKSSGNRRKGIFNALLYGFFIFGVYVLLSAPFHLMNLAPDILNEISTNVWLNVAFFLIFVFFAGSFFGYYEITLPSGLANKVSSAESTGGVLGIFFMAMTLAIVSFSCTGPIIGSLLAGTLTQGAWNLSAGMAGFGIALGLPFALFAMFPGWLNSLPKSGGWLNTVKVVLGFVELALAVKFLSNADLVAHWGILKREVFFGLWILIGLLTTVYLLGLIKFPHDSPIKFKELGKGRIATAVVFLAFTVYLIPGLFGANLSLLSGFPPPMYYTLFEDDSEETLGNISEEDLEKWGFSDKCPHDLPCFKDFHDGLAYARHANKPILIDFTGFACVNCRKMEENVWPMEGILDLLSEDVVLISLYVDDKENLPDEQQITVEHKGYSKNLKTVGQKWSFFQTVNFKSNTQPLYVILSPDLEILADPVGYMPDAVAYKEWIKGGIDAFDEASTSNTAAN
jgi:thiol:disulfide interchange protein DsbD